MKRDTVGSCDCCGKTRLLSFINYPPVGDTWACAECISGGENPEMPHDLFAEGDTLAPVGPSSK